MVDKSVKDFVELINTDAEVAKELAKKGQDYITENYPDGEISDEVAIDLICNVFIPMAEQHGYNLTLDDFKDYEAEQIELARGDLSDDELEAVAGGTWTFTGNACYIVGATLGSSGVNSKTIDVCGAIGVHYDEEKAESDDAYKGASICFIYGKSWDF